MSPVPVGVEDAGERRAGELGRVGHAAQAAGRRVGEHEQVVLADEDTVGRQLNQASKECVRHALPLRMDHEAGVVTGKIRPGVQCPCPGNPHV